MLIHIQYTYIQDLDGIKLDNIQWIYFDKVLVCEFCLPYNIESIKCVIFIYI